MSTDRTVNTDALATLGSIIDDTAKRDAIHLAVYPAVAGELLHAGQDVGFSPDGVALGIGAPAWALTAVGIVDPFLRNVVRAGQRFWLLLYPRQISSLRHVWSHPAFTDEPEVGSLPTNDATRLSTLAIRQYADAAGLSANGLLQRAGEWLDAGIYSVDGGRWEGFDLPDAFWDHYTVVTGRVVPADRRRSFFSCSC